MALDGVVRVRYFVTVFTGPRENLRGVHAGQFDWTPTVGGRITGTLEGISNAGVLRARTFSRDCERCDEAGIVSGHLFGTGNGGLLAVSSGFGPAWRVDGGKIVSLTA